MMPMMLMMLKITAASSPITLTHRPAPPHRLSFVVANVTARSSGTTTGLLRVFPDESAHAYPTFIAGFSC